ncbi:MAG TPA: phenylalanine--tRNA ligase subunit alpha [Lentisphaeria bacterium]|nr:phenylalanine--tRNA ligase subunit alpha [Lentisphaeria bacterium]
MLDQLRALQATFQDASEAATSLEQLEQLRTDFLGRKGKLTALLKGLKDVAPAERGIIGKAANLIKTEIGQALDAAQEKLDQAALEARLASEWLDVTLPAAPSRIGGLHPVSRIQYEIEDIFKGMGFSVLDGPHVELDYYNFEALNIPQDHPARDMQDTFYFDNGAILRTHTSAIQVRGMEHIKPPFRIIGPGKVFRVERPDWCHEIAFHQLEGMVVGRNITVAHLIDCMKTLLREVFQEDVNVRLRPGYFPFVEPGFELDIARGDSWLELMPCGLIHPSVLRAGGIDPEEWSGFAFGLGLDRLVMMRYGVEDIRHLHSGDLRFSSQFV